MGGRVMRAYFGESGSDITPAFRAGGRGKARAVAKLTIPLRHDDLISILYHGPLTGAALDDDDQVRAAILDALVNHGANAINDDKTTLTSDLNAATLGPDALARLARCQRRIGQVFPDEVDHDRSPVKRSPIVRPVPIPRAGTPPPRGHAA